MRKALEPIGFAASLIPGKIECFLRWGSTGSVKGTLESVYPCGVSVKGYCTLQVLPISGNAPFLV